MVPAPEDFVRFDRLPDNSLAQDDLEERGLPGPIAAEERDAVPPPYAERGVCEEHAITIGLADTFSRDHALAASPLRFENHLDTTCR